MDRKYFYISGYWKDTGSKFENLVVTDYDDEEEECRHEVFLYGISERELQEYIKDKEDTFDDFVIESYSEII